VVLEPAQLALQLGQGVQAPADPRSAEAVTDRSRSTALRCAIVIAHVAALPLAGSNLARPLG
jgi:hypothetical protein